MRCNIFESIFHFVRDCPHYKSGLLKKKNEIKLQYYTEEVFHILSEETTKMAVLDSGCTKTVYGMVKPVDNCTSIKAEVVSKDIPLFCCWVRKL